MKLIDFLRDLNNSLPSNVDIETKHGKNSDTISFIDNCKLRCNSKDKEIEIVSPSVEIFLQVLITYNKYNTQVVYHANYDLQPFTNKIDYYIANGVSKKWLRDFFASA